MQSHIHITFECIAFWCSYFTEMLVKHIVQ